MTQLTTSQSKSVSNPVLNSAWGAEEASTADILIPRLHLMQAMSDYVKRGVTKEGEIVNSVDGEVLCAVGEKLEIIPITMFRQWAISEEDAKRKGKFNYVTKIPMTKQNENLRFNDVENGVNIRRQKVLNFFVLLPDKIDELPFMVSFKSTSFPTGKQLSTHFTMSSMKKMAPARQVFNLSSARQSSDQGEYCTFEIAPGRKATDEEVEKAFGWYQSFQTTHVTVEGEEDTGKSEAPF